MALHPKQRFDSFFLIFFFAQAGLIALYWTLTDYDVPNAPPENNIAPLYTFSQDVAIMIFVGFGFLMTFLRKYGYGAVGFNFLISAFCVEWVILCIGFWKRVYSGEWHHPLEINIAAMIDGNFGAGSCMIAFGALIGKVSPGEMMFIGFWQMIFYSLNFYVVQLVLKCIDIGGSLIIHAFGAYFGLAVSMFLSPKGDHHYKENRANYLSDLFSMIGTIFLWLNWPSFNSAFAAPFAQNRAIANTFFSLTSCVMSTFLFSRAFSHTGTKFDIIHIQNAAIAGGVAVGGGADLRLNAGGAMLVGFTAGCLSCFGFRFLQPFLDRKIGLKDTCGVHNLHGMPGILGGLVAVVGSAAATVEKYGQFEYDEMFYWGSKQGAYQLAGIGITLGIAIASGTAVGFFMRFFHNFGHDAPSEETGDGAVSGLTHTGHSAFAHFHDGQYWHMEEAIEDARDPTSHKKAHFMPESRQSEINLIEMRQHTHQPYTFADPEDKDATKDAVELP